MKLILCFVVAAICCAVSAEPTVSNVRASQRTDGTGVVDVYYDLSGGTELMKARVVFSNDGGATWNVVPNSASVVGDVGACVRNGTNKHIVWDPGDDAPQVHWPQAKAKVIVDQYASGPTMVVNLPGTATLELVRIPAGSFKMGSNDPWSQDCEKPVHDVNIGYSFWMGKYEVTVRQWRAIMDGNSSVNPGDDHPFGCSWNSVAGPGGFLQKLEEYVQSSGQGAMSFRLPTEAEWEYACRAGSTTRFYYGDSNCDPTGFACDLMSYAWYYGNNYPSTTKAVGLKIPNAFGLYDMHGNVMEFCWDWWHDNYNGAPSDGSGWLTSTSSYRVMRGGWYAESAIWCRSSNRRQAETTTYSDSTGFRVVRVP